MRASLLLIGYVLILLSCLAGVGVYYHLRRKRFEPLPSEDRLFRCDGCGFVYTDDPDVDRSRCPQCGKHNESYRF
jgi:DNA-directed RNA polymerase subunit M/transcription elongation factor TFIIS